MIAARRNFRLDADVSLAALLGASGAVRCGGSPKPKPAELGPNVPVLGVRQAWTAKIGAMDGLALDVHVNANTLDRLPPMVKWRPSTHAPVAMSGAPS